MPAKYHKKRKKPSRKCLSKAFEKGKNKKQKYGGE